MNASFRLVFGRYLFYYSPGDLWHLTSVQTLPIYLAGGFAIDVVLRKTRPDSLFFASAATVFTFVLLFLT